MQLEHIISWLEQTEPGPENLQSQSNKVISHPPLISPPASESPHKGKRPMDPPDSTRKQKRQRTTQSTSKTTEAPEDEGDFETPKQNRAWAGPSNPQLFSATQTPSFVHDLPPSSASGYSESVSNQSGTSSPTRGFRNLELSPDGAFETCVISLNDPRLPEQLVILISELESCLSNGEGIISRSQQSQIEAKSLHNREFKGMPNFIYGDAETRDALGCTPSPEDVERLLAEARECHATRQNEAGWNMAVHFPVLHQAIYGPSRKTKSVGFAPCTTAKILKEYVATDRKMVDFCLYLDPKAPERSTGRNSVFAAIESLCRALPAGVINHTSFFALRSRPIAVSIETKRRSGQQDSAELQIGTWHKAQWKLLTHLVSRSGGSLDSLPFLPGVIINGHDWSFVATTRDGAKTTLWLEQAFGTTSSVRGVYKLFWGLQRLIKWVDEVYWPWFMNNVLSLGVEVE